MKNLPSSGYKENSGPISLIDMVVLLIKYWKVMLLTLASGAVLTILVAWQMPKKNNYTSLYSVAEYTSKQGDTLALESPSALLTLVQNVYQEAEKNRFISTVDEKKIPFEIKASAPENSRMIMLTSSAGAQYFDWITTLHKEIFSRLKKHQDDKVQHRKESLQEQLNATRDQLENAQKAKIPNSDVLLPGYQERIAQLEILLGQLKKGELVQVAVKSIESTGVNSTLIAVLGMTFSALMAPFVAILFHFFTLVLVRLKETQD